MKYKVNLRVAEKDYKGEGNSVLEGIDMAVGKLDKSMLIKCANYISVEFGKQKADSVLYPIILRRVLVNNVAREILAKKMSIMLK